MHYVSALDTKLPWFCKTVLGFIKCFLELNGFCASCQNFKALESSGVPGIRGLVFLLSELNSEVHLNKNNWDYEFLSVF